MEEITITNIRELYSRLAYVELVLDVENNGKTITFVCPAVYQEDKNHALGYSYWGNYVKYIYNFDEYDNITTVVSTAFQFWKESYNKNLELRIDAFKRSIL